MARTGARSEGNEAKVRGIERVRGAETDCGGGGAGRAGEVEITAGDVAESRIRPALVANGNFGDNGLSACGQACLIRDAAHDRAGRSRSCSCEAERYHQHPGRRHVSGPVANRIVQTSIHFSEPDSVR